MWELRNCPFLILPLPPPFPYSSSSSGGTTSTTYFLHSPLMLIFSSSLCQKTETLPPIPLANIYKYTTYWWGLNGITSCGACSGGAHNHCQVFSILWIRRYSDFQEVFKVSIVVFIHAREKLTAIYRANVLKLQVLCVADWALWPSDLGAHTYRLQGWIMTIHTHACRERKKSPFL